MNHIFIWNREARILFYQVAAINVGLFPFQSLLIILNIKLIIGSWMKQEWIYCFILVSFKLFWKKKFIGIHVVSFFSLSCASCKVLDLSLWCIVSPTLHLQLPLNLPHSPILILWRQNLILAALKSWEMFDCLI